MHFSSLCREVLLSCTKTRAISKHKSHLTGWTKLISTGCADGFHYIYAVVQKHFFGFQRFLDHHKKT